MPECPLVLFTGSRDWPTFARVLNVMCQLQEVLGPYRVLHGGARGVDTFAGIGAGMLGLEEDRMPAQWNVYGKAAGPIRNTTMLMKRPVLVAAFWHGQSRGTLDCIDKAVNTFRIPLLLFRN